MLGLGNRRIAVIALDNVYPGSLMGVIDVVETSNRHMRARVAHALPGASPRQGLFSVTRLSLRSGQITTKGNLRINVESMDSCRTRFDLVMLPAFEVGPQRDRARKLAALAKLTEWLRAQRGQGAIFAAHCSGAMLLAEAGILDDRTATIPVGLEPDFRRRYPHVTLDMTQSIVVDQDTICAAGLADGHRLVWRALEYFRPGLIAAQCGLDLFFHDQGSLALSSHAPALQELGNPLVDFAKYRLNEWVSRHVSGNPDLMQLAQELGISTRTLFRRFKAATGVTPHAYVQRLRIEMAKGVLRLTEVSIEQVAARVGYANKTHFCKLFRRYAGLTPHAFRLQSHK